MVDKEILKRDKRKVNITSIKALFTCFVAAIVFIQHTKVVNISAKSWIIVVFGSGTKWIKIM